MPRGNISVVSCHSLGSHLLWPQQEAGSIVGMGEMWIAGRDEKSVTEWNLRSGFVRPETIKYIEVLQELDSWI